MRNIDLLKFGSISLNIIYSPQLVLENSTIINFRIIVEMQIYRLVNKFTKYLLYQIHSPTMQVGNMLNVPVHWQWRFSCSPWLSLSEIIRIKGFYCISSRIWSIYALQMLEFVAKQSKLLEKVNVSGNLWWKMDNPEGRS